MANKRPVEWFDQSNVNVSTAVSGETGTDVLDQMLTGDTAGSTVTRVIGTIYVRPDAINQRVFGH